jgi:hypothetical protein
VRLRISAVVENSSAECNDGVRGVDDHGERCSPAREGIARALSRVAPGCGAEQVIGIDLAPERLREP